MIRYICAQPATQYYTWQVEVMINNFKKHGVNPNMIDILCGIENNNIPADWIKLQQHYNTIRFFFYNDNRKDKSYIPSIYFNLLSSHMKANPDLINQRLFLHDSDIVFTRPPELNFINNANIWYMSDTNSYINYNYIQQKGNHIYEKMCDIIGIDKLIPKLMNMNSGGAQYIITGEDYKFWDKVEEDSIKLYSYFCEVEPQHTATDYPIQKWTAGMWSLLWNAWLFGHETKVDKGIDFGWATNDISDIDKHWILHNAGVTGGDEHKDLFFKGSYMNRLPYDDDLNVKPTSASSYYWNEIKETGRVSILK